MSRDAIFLIGIDLFIAVRDSKHLSRKAKRIVREMQLLINSEVAKDRQRKAAAERREESKKPESIA